MEPNQDNNTEPELTAEELEELIAKLPQNQKQKLAHKVYGGAIPSSRTFFHRKYALQLIPDLKAMEEEQCVLVYPYADYPHWSKKTLWMYITDAFRYAATYLDESGWISKLKERTKTTEDSDAVRIVFKTVGPFTLKARRVAANDPMARDTKTNVKRDLVTDDVPNWRQELMSWMEETTESGKMFTREVLLSDDDVNYLTAMFETDELFGISISPDQKKFKVVRL